MTPWELTPVRAMIYLSLFGDGTFAGRMASPLNREEAYTMDGLVVFYLQHGQRVFEKRYPECPLVTSDWFLDFMKYHQTIHRIQEYLHDKDKAPHSRNAFLQEMIWSVREYSVFDTRQLLASEEKPLWEYFNLLTSIVRNVMRDARAAVCGKDVHASGHEDRASAGESAAGQWERYLEALTDRNAYLALIEALLSAGGREDWNRTNLHEYPESVWRDRYDLRLLRDEYFHAAGNQTLREWKDGLEGTMWEQESAYYLMRRLRGHGHSEISDTIRQYISQYYNRNIATSDFCLKRLMGREDGPNRQGMQVDMLLCFAGRFSFDMPQNKRKALLLFCAYPPPEGSFWLPRNYLTEEEIRDTVQENLRRGIVNDMVLGWHIRYCMDYPDAECTARMISIACNQTRKKWVRRIAIQCACRLVDVRTACDTIMPRIQGDMFFFVAEQYRQSGDERLAALVWRYGEKYASHKLRCDVTLIHLQDRRGMERFLEHVEKRRQIPPECRAYHVTDAIRRINRPELIAVLKGYLFLCLRDNFRDNPEDSLLDAVCDALVGIGSARETEQKAVRRIFEEALERYGDISWKCEVLERCIGRIPGC